MGYLSRYTLPVISPIEHRDAFRAWLDEHRGMSPDILDGHERISWYDQDADLIAAMRATGVTSIRLHRIGEEAGDLQDRQFTRVPDGTIVLHCYCYSMVRDAEPYETLSFPAPK